MSTAQMITLAWSDNAKRIDLGVATNEQITWLENAITISLFTDALASTDDEIPNNSNDRRGYWGDDDLPTNESLGSKLWLLKREKITPEVIRKTHDYITQALKWLIKELYLKAYTVSVERGGLNRLDFQINCQLPNGEWVSIYKRHQHIDMLSTENQ